MNEALVSIVRGSGPSVIETLVARLSTSHSWTSAGPSLPTESTAKTAKVCWPGRSTDSVCGLVQVVAAAPSRLQRKPAPGSSELNTNIALPEAVGSSGPELMLAEGCSVSMLQLREAVPTFPAASVERTVKVWGPSPRSV